MEIDEKTKKRPLEAISNVEKALPSLKERIKAGKARKRGTIFFHTGIFKVPDSSLMLSDVAIAPSGSVIVFQLIQ